MVALDSIRFLSISLKRKMWERKYEKGLSKHTHIDCLKPRHFFDARRLENLSLSNTHTYTLTHTHTHLFTHTHTHINKYSYMHFYTHTHTNIPWCSNFVCLAIESTRTTWQLPVWNNGWQQDLWPKKGLWD